MDELQDIRDQEFVLRYVSGFPLNYQILQDGQSVGQMHKPTNHKPEVLASFAGVDWELTPKGHILGVIFSYELRFKGSAPAIAVFSWNGAIVDATTRYRLILTGDNNAKWQCGRQEVAWVSGDYKSPHFRTAKELDPLHAVVLTVLGMTLLANEVLSASGG